MSYQIQIASVDLMTKSTELVPGLSAHQFVATDDYETIL